MRGPNIKLKNKFIGWKIPAWLSAKSGKPKFWLKLISGNLKSRIYSLADKLFSYVIIFLRVPQIVKSEIYSNKKIKINAEDIKMKYLDLRFINLKQ